ncbi:flexible cuticle protein 12-like [Anthonomus grandis grandis]|uniref:flexible cuticle protein 12-like n=1 Tax=Anthonomus grandis grandis TaxID=2921223 RepID=UPI002165BD89|nr:flexible cuticle protein 12-like [Anthonomus grandis grandis]
MRPIILILALLGFTRARPQFQNAFRQLQQQFTQPFAAGGQLQQQQQIRASPFAVILRYSADLAQPTGFQYVYQQSDQQQNAVIGEIKNKDTPDESLAVEGQYSYVGDDGKQYTVHYTADENGFRPTGEHIPPAADTSRKLGIPSSALASLNGGGIGR